MALVTSTLTDRRRIFLFPPLNSFCVLRTHGKSISKERCNGICPPPCFADFRPPPSLLYIYNSSFSCNLLLSSNVATLVYRNLRRSVILPTVIPACQANRERKRKRKLMDTDFDRDVSSGKPTRPFNSSSDTSAINKLPYELLNEIFLWTLPPVPSFRANESPLVLTHVCKWWRESAENQSPLWDTIYLPSPVEGLSDGVVQLCKLWLERSKSRPLSVDFHLASDYQPWKISPEHVVNIQQIVQILAPHASRITKLLRIFPRFLLDDLKIENMTSLDDLFICDVSDDASGRTVVTPGNFSVPDTLRCLSLRQTFFDIKAFSSLSKIRHLDLWQLQGEGQMSISTSLNLLQELSWLESCTLDVAQGEFNREILAPEITMPNLSFFFISWDWLVDVGPILDVLNTPNLKRLGLRGPPPTRRQWTHLRHFIKRGRPALTQLSIKEIGFTDIQLLDCLRLVPSLTNLSLSHCSVDSNFIKALRLDNRLPIAHNILPNLEFLSLEACDDFEVRDLVGMLGSRGTYRPLDTAYRRLRGIRLSFCRRIMESHRVELENCGVDNVIIRVARGRTERRTPPR